MHFATRQVGLFAAVALFILAIVAQGCFIRNCPIGGKKRSSVQEVGRLRKCMSCGPYGNGQCIGPTTCCSMHFGCIIGSTEALECRRENDIPYPCSVAGNSCGTDRVCVAPGICCNDWECKLSSKCFVRKSEKHSRSRVQKLRHARNYFI